MVREDDHRWASVHDAWKTNAPEPSCSERELTAEEAACELDDAEAGRCRHCKGWVVVLEARELFLPGGGSEIRAVVTCTDDDCPLSGDEVEVVVHHHGYDADDAADLITTERLGG